MHNDADLYNVQCYAHGHVFARPCGSLSAFQVRSCGPPHSPVGFRSVPGEGPPAPSLSVRAHAVIPELESDKSSCQLAGTGARGGILLATVALLRVAHLRSNLGALHCMPEGVFALGDAVGTACKWNSFRDAATLPTGGWNYFRAPVVYRHY